jgi:hypothetical protein
MATSKNTKGKKSIKPQSKSFVDKANDFVDWAFRGAANKKVGEVNKSVQSKLDSTRKKVGDVNKKVQKDLDPYRKKAADLNKSVQKKLDPVRDALYGKDKKTKTPETKKGPTKKATNLPEVKVTPPKKTTTTSNNTSIEQKAKDVMSGKYGTGAARKAVLGADYAKVQAIINKKATATKAKPTGPSKGTLATIQKNIKDEQEGRLKFDEPVASVSTKSTEVKPEVKPAAVDVDKSIDAAMKGIAKSKIMKKGGTVKMQYGGAPKLTGAELKRRGEAKKRMGNEAKANGEAMKNLGEAKKAAYMRKKSEAAYKKKNGNYYSPSGRSN